MRYKSKATDCEASQFDLAAAETGDLFPAGVYREPGDGVVDRYYVVTAHGQRAYLADGDYVVTEPDGRGHYPVKIDIFERRWEPILD